MKKIFILTILLLLYSCSVNNEYRFKIQLNDTRESVVDLVWESKNWSYQNLWFWLEYNKYNKVDWIFFPSRVNSEWELYNWYIYWNINIKSSLEDIKKDLWEYYKTENIEWTNNSLKSYSWKVDWMIIEVTFYNINHDYDWIKHFKWDIFSIRIKKWI